MYTVTIYTKPVCPQCRMTKLALDKKGVPWEETDLTQDEGILAWITEDLGCNQAPVCVVDDGTGEDHWSGFRPDCIDRIAAFGNH